jgi:hypothetical protein
LQQQHRRLIGRTVDEAAATGLDVAFRQLGNVGISLNYGPLNYLARDWAQRYSYDLITRIDVSTGRQVGHAVSSWMETGEHLDLLIRQLEPVFGRNRAEMIAATETTRAFAEGTLLGYRQSGQVEATQWKTARDERVCDICRPLHGIRGDLQGQFVHPGGIGRSSRHEGRSFRAPAHVRCRCAMAPIVIEAAPRVFPVAQPVEPPAAPITPAGVTAEEARNRIAAIAARYRPQFAAVEALDQAAKAAQTQLVTAYQRRDELTVERLTADTARQKEIDKELRRLNKEIKAYNQQINDGINAPASKRRLLLDMTAEARAEIYVDDPTDIQMRATYPTERWREGYAAFNKLVSKDVWSGATVQAVVDTTGRASHTGGVIFIAPDEKITTIVHEIGHAFEQQSGVYPKVKEFYDRRTAGDSLEKLSDVTGISNYGEDEITRRDRWLDAYVGREYGRESTEVVSMGLQWMHEAPEWFAANDPEHFDFIYNLVRGR